MKKRTLRNTIGILVAALVLSTAGVVAQASEVVEEPVAAEVEVEGLSSDPALISEVQELRDSGTELQANEFDPALAEARAVTIPNLEFRGVYVTPGSYTIGGNEEPYIMVNLGGKYSKVEAIVYNRTLGKPYYVDMVYHAQSGYYVVSPIIDGAVYDGDYFVTHFYVYGGNGDRLVLEVENPTSYTIYNARNENMDAFVSRLYYYVLGRVSSREEITGWSKVLAEKTNTGSQVAYGFFFSQELLNKNLSNAQYVDLLFAAMFDRAADAGGKAGWLNTLNNGVSRMHVFKGFTDSQEFIELCAAYNINKGTVEVTEARDVNSNTTAFVYRLYQKALARTADVGGLNGWVQVILDHKETPQQVAAGFIFSQEFKNQNLSNTQYVQTLYRTFLGREAEAGGLSAWVGQLDKGISREEVFEGFAYSPEFGGIVASFGL